MEPLGPGLGAFGDRGQAYAGELRGLQVWVLTWIVAAFVSRDVFFL